MSQRPVRNARRSAQPVKYNFSDDSDDSDQSEEEESADSAVSSFKIDGKEEEEESDDDSADDAGSDESSMPIVSEPSISSDTDSLMNTKKKGGRKSGPSAVPPR